MLSPTHWLVWNEYASTTRMPSASNEKLGKNTALAVLLAYEERSGNDVAKRIQDNLDALKLNDEQFDAWLTGNVQMPPWLGHPDLHSSHRAVLLGKDYDYYKQFDWTETPAVQDSKGRWPYVWPA